MQPNVQVAAITIQTVSFTGTWVAVRSWLAPANDGAGNPIKGLVRPKRKHAIDKERQ